MYVGVIDCMDAIRQIINYDNHMPFLYLKFTEVWKPFMPYFLLRVIFDLFTAFLLIIILCKTLILPAISDVVHKITLLVETCLNKLWNPPRDQEESLIITKYNHISRF
ncbi:hypothetical protein TSAR_016930 [Trichomalopsis sarcophagae]|uniref:Uncharacterized protein n=1 Tax=Trichomalopsis sarcophagae TaxID=543379 RepID=A0A232EGJ4_9HYME|nr:hypothetical protein TSAR_016930 [Trichomalopsis sarcophagae]